MALPASGVITLKGIGTEFSTSPTLKTNYGKGGAPGSGEISIKDFYGRSAITQYDLFTSGTIYTETDGTTGDIFINAGVTTDTYGLGATYAGVGYDGSYYLAIMDASAATLNSFNALEWDAGAYNSGGAVVNGTWNAYTYPSLGYSIAYSYNANASYLYSGMSAGNLVNYYFYT